jgi:hypothetical protein
MHDRLLAWSLAASKAGPCLDALVIGTNFGIFAKDSINGGEHLPHARFRDGTFDDYDKLGLV